MDVLKLHLGPSDLWCCQSSLCSFFLLLTGGTTVHFEENPVKENAKAYDSNETEKPNLYTPLKGNTFYQYFFHGVTNDCLNVLK